MGVDIGPSSAWANFLGELNELFLQDASRAFSVPSRLFGEITGSRFTCSVGNVARNERGVAIRYFCCGRLVQTRAGFGKVLLLSNDFSTPALTMRMTMQASFRPIHPVSRREVGTDPVGSWSICKAYSDAVEKSYATEGPKEFSRDCVRKKEKIM